MQIVTVKDERLWIAGLQNMHYVRLLCIDVDMQSCSSYSSALLGAYFPTRVPSPSPQHPHLRSNMMSLRAYRTLALMPLCVCQLISAFNSTLHPITQMPEILSFQLSGPHVPK